LQPRALKAFIADWFSDLRGNQMILILNFGSMKININGYVHPKTKNAKFLRKLPKILKFCNANKNFEALKLIILAKFLNPTHI